MTFANARAQKKFLQYTVTEAVEGRGHLLKEFTLGVEVFGRGQSFDPRTHNIVRVEASKLRARLGRYYATEGRGNPLRIEFPKGSYAPVFHKNEEPDSPQDRAQEPVRTQAVAPSKSLPWMRRHVRLVAVFAALTLVALAGAVVFRVHGGATTQSTVPSVAVLPFVNLNDDGNDLLSDGITEDLLDSLARVAGYA